MVVLFVIIWAAAFAKAAQAAAKTSFYHVANDEFDVFVFKLPFIFTCDRP